jgi:hypothetical protein
MIWTGPCEAHEEEGASHLLAEQVMAQQVGEDLLAK